ncbi:MAG TPA: hypothetical protein VNW92_00220 [Polyangiaceae bacterium]|nr:hypothetical protein [Polyangiaceae bacterium]
MRLSALLLCTTWVTGCAGHNARPVTSASAPATLPRPDTAVETRHRYLFTQGRAPVRIVEREQAPPSAAEVSSEPPSFQ